MTNTHRVLVGIPNAARVLAGSIYAQRTGRPADNDSFTPGFRYGGVNYAVACWYVDNVRRQLFDTLLAAYPAARVAIWAEGDATPEQQLATLGITRPAQGV